MKKIIIKNNNNKKEQPLPSKVINNTLIFNMIYLYTV